MNDDHQREKVKRILADLFGRLPRKECRTCDCLQGFLAQLEIDAKDDVADLIDPFKVDRERMHGCLGCDPCPPGEVFSDYIKKHQDSRQ